MNSLLLSRRRYLQLLDSALAVGQFRFARLAALNWLAAYPGDLAVSLAYARALVGEKRLDAAVSALQGLRRADPEYLEAVDLLAQVEQARGGAVSAPVAAHLFALTGRSRERRTLAIWAGSLWLARQAMHEGKLPLADEMLRDVLRSAQDEPLAQVTHLAWLRSSPGFDPHAGREIALGYHRASPDCLAVMLHLADWSLQVGEEEYAVALLHQAAARDVGAQAVQRVWKTEQPYRSLWPERLELALNLSLPAEVSMALGWNRLAAGGTGAAGDEETDSPPVPDPGDVANRPPADATAPSEPLPASEPASPAPEAVEAVDAMPASGPVREHGPAAAADEAESSLLTRAAASTPLAPENARPAAARLPAAPARAVSHAAEISWAMEPEDASPLTTPDETLAAAESVDLPEAHSLWRPVEGAAAVARARLEALVGERRKPRPPQARKPLDPELRQVSKDLDAAARRLKLPGVAHRDGRFPVYVIFSLRGRLEAHYGAGVAALIESEMEALAQAVGRRRGWNARLFLADDPGSLAALGLEAVRSGDPWELKLALADLDAALARRGECIGALLIVGGPEIVPFHRLPNPVDDQDADVPSDNPYATRNENYFLPEWPVGRLPGGAGMDARLLLDSLRRIRQRHTAIEPRSSWLRRLLARLRALLGRAAAAGLSPFGASVGALSPAAEFSGDAEHVRGLLGRRPAAFGYTAAVWKPAAAKVFAVLGRPGRMHVSPPMGYDGASDPTGGSAALPKVSGRFGYFNLHGVVDAPEWFGQREAHDPTGAPDFPVALRPQDVLRSRQADAKRQRAEIPTLVFTQACYGLHIAGRQPEHSLALSFLSAGSLAVAGCTCMSYGAITPPLAAGDLLAHSFWRQARQGQPAGEALRQAKIYLASEMVARQGYLDGEDQKTLISFVLYGDPLATAYQTSRLPKTVRYVDGPPLEAPTICDRAVGAEAVGAEIGGAEIGEPLPPEVLGAVRRVVTRCLPGMADARLIYARPRTACSGQGHACPTSQLEHLHHGAEAAPAAGSHPPAQAAAKPRGRLQRKAADIASCCLVTLSKPVTLAGGAHPRVARLTLNEDGELVKLVVSR